MLSIVEYSLYLINLPIYQFHFIIAIHSSNIDILDRNQGPVVNHIGTFLRSHLNEYSTQGVKGLCTYKLGSHCNSVHIFNAAH